MSTRLWYNVNKCIIALTSVGVDVARQVPAKEISLFRAGGVIDLIATPHTVTELVTTIKLARSHHLPLFTLGGGSNLLVKDGGYHGVAISLKHFNGILLDGNHVFVGASEKLPHIAYFSAKNQLSGLEALSGIPATIGGATIKNAGCYGVEISDIIEAVTLLDLNSLTIKRISRAEIDYSYRSSGDTFKDSIVLYVRLRLSPSNGDLIKSITDYRAKRLASQPTEPSLGSVFLKTPEGVSAGYYVDKARLKGTRIGGAQISDKHANFIINTGCATATDYLKLTALMHDVVYKKYKISLQKEIDIIGEDYSD